MLKDKLVLCVGNSSRQTDELTTKYAELNLSSNCGLIDNINAELAELGFYHSSLGDFGSTPTFLQLIKRFNHVIFFNQPKESYDDIRTYDLTVQSLYLAKARYKTTVDEIEI